MNAYERLLTRFPTIKKIIVIPVCVIIFVVCLPLAVLNGLRGFWAAFWYDASTMFVGLVDVTKETLSTGAGFKSRQARIDQARREAEDELPFNAQ